MIFALANMISVFFIFGFQVHGDTPEYLKVISFFKGEAKAEILLPLFALRPLGPILATPFQFLGEGAGLLLQNILFYLGCAWLVFKIAEILFKSSKKAFLASLFFVTAVPVLDAGLAYMTDSSGWFFYLFSIFLTLKFFQSKNSWLIVANGFLCGAAMFFKESAGLGIFFFALMMLLARGFSWSAKIKKIALFAVFFLFAFVVGQALLFHYFSCTSFDIWLAFLGSAVGEGFLINSLRYLGQLFLILGLLWPFILLGFWQEAKQRNKSRLKVFFALLPSSFIFLAWPTTAGARTVFLFAPLGILLAVQGFSFFIKRLNRAIRPAIVSFLLVVIILFNYYLHWVNPYVDFTQYLIKLFN